MHNEVTDTAIIKVGALNVASIKLNEEIDKERVDKGEELAYFEFGSTVVLLFSSGTTSFLSHLAEGVRVKMGERIAWLQDRCEWKPQ
jgi:phosphatidylserine decarboxylase